MQQQALLESLNQHLSNLRAERKRAVSAICKNSKVTKRELKAVDVVNEIVACHLVRKIKLDIENVEYLSKQIGHYESLVREIM